MKEPRKRALPPLFERLLRAKIETLPAEIREIVRAHFADLLHQERQPKNK